MTKKALSIIGLIVGTLLVVSCTDDDKHLLRDGFRVEGELSPNFKLPVATGEMTFDDLINRFGGTLDAYITADDVLTFHYNLTQTDKLDIGDVFSTPAPTRTRTTPKPLPHKGDPIVSTDTTFSYTLPIDFFSQVDLLQDAEFKLSQVLLKGEAHVTGVCPDNVRDDLRQYVSARIDSLHVAYVGKNGPTEFGIIHGAQTSVTDLTADNKITIDTNLASIINDLPTEITVDFRLHIDVSEDFLNNNIQNVEGFSELLDSLRMTTLHYSLNLDLLLPFEVSIQSLHYDYTVNLGDNSSNNIFDEIDSALVSLFGEDGANIDSTAMEVVLRLENGIPLNLNLNAVMVDGNGVPVLTFLQNERVAAAQTKPVPGSATGARQASEATRSDISVGLNLEEARKFLSATDMKLGISLSSDGTDYIQVRRDDKLKFKLYIRLNPVVQLSWDILEDGLL